MARGDIVLYKGPAGNLADWLISHNPRSDGPFVHCEIDLGNGMFIGEHGQGLVVHKKDQVCPCTWVSLAEKPGVKEGMDWITEQVKAAEASQSSRSYGVLDIVSDIFQVLGSNIILGQPGKWDCSDFVTRYLLAGGMAGPLGDLAKEPGLVTPNDLARAFGALQPGRS